jgi:20S proteasome subunit alpha 7
MVHDAVKDKEFELELSWICKESNYQHHFVPKDLAKRANDAAIQAAQMED